MRARSLSAGVVLFILVLEGGVVDGGVNEGVLLEVLRGLGAVGVDGLRGFICIRVGVDTYGGVPSIEGTSIKMRGTHSGSEFIGEGG